VVGSGRFTRDEVLVIADQQEALPFDRFLDWADEIDPAVVR
jgi:hypothetical protein